MLCLMAWEKGVRALRTGTNWQDREGLREREGRREKVKEGGRKEGNMNVKVWRELRRLCISEIPYVRL